MAGDVNPVRESIDNGCQRAAATPIGLVAGAPARSRGIGLLLLTVAMALAPASSARAATPVPLGTAEPFAVLAGSTITNTARPWSTAISG